MLDRFLVWLGAGMVTANVNRLMSSAPEDLERLAGMARLTACRCG